MIHRKIDDKMRIVLGSDCMRILRCKPGDEVDISMIIDDEASCDSIIIRKVKTTSYNQK